MSRVFEKGNSELNALVMETVAIRNDDRALEIGFGTGKLISEMAGHLQEGCIEGIDFSRSMVQIARKKNKKQIEIGNVKLHLGDFDEMPFADNSFDKIFSVNTIYFWKNPETTIGKIHRILKPGGKLILGFHDRSQMEKMPLSKDVFQYYSPSEVTDLLSIHGSLANVDIIPRQGKQKTCYCAVGTK